VSHVSGNVSHIGMRAEGLHAGLDTPENLGEALLLLMAFIFGAALCGVLSAKEQVQVGRGLNGFAMIGNSLLLALSFHFAEYQFAKYFAAAACGLQNSMCTVYFGPTCRTTHLTGLATDAGTTIGRLFAVAVRSCCFLRSLDEYDRAEVEIELRKLRTFAVLGFSFLTGAACGAWLSRWLGAHALLVPASVTGTIGLAYLTCQAFGRSRSSLKEQHHMSSDRATQEAQGSGRIWSFLNAINKESGSLETSSGLSSAANPEAAAVRLDFDGRRVDQDGEGQMGA